MVKKVLLVIDDNSKASSSSIQELLKINDNISALLIQNKNKITQYHQNKSWDKFKKLSNEYEMIFTTPVTSQNISDYNPVSRSFFKLWEILCDFHPVFFTEHRPVRCLFLAEGPGGFAEAFIKYRRDSKCTGDEYHGISLRSNNDKHIPDWKLQKEFMKQIMLHYGEDGTGNLYNFENIKYLRDTIGGGSIDFITADGGFDFSADFNNQEDQSFRLILCEVVAALLLQKEGGHFVLKIFDMFNDYTLKLLQILKGYYTTITMVKPLTSRPANSEKYVVCSGFRLPVDTSLLHDLIALIHDQQKLKSFFIGIPFDHAILHHLITYNVHYTIRQIYYISRTIGYINKFSQKSNEGKIHTILDEHARKSLRWCKKYQIPVISSLYSC
jgi:23S rRNA U2552 (ribose-2'-O)-methylase RlmE/FtsJ